MNDQGKLYIASDDEALLLRICVSAHCVLGAHRGNTTISEIIKQKLHWLTIDADVKAFFQSFLVFLLSASGDKVLGPLGHQIHAEKVRELLHFDYLYVGKSTGAHEYILILKDNFMLRLSLPLQDCRRRNDRSRVDRVLLNFRTSSHLVFRSGLTLHE